MDKQTKTTARFHQGREADEERRQWRWRLEADQNDQPLSQSTEGYNNFAEAVHSFEVSTGAQASHLRSDSESGTALRYLFFPETMEMKTDLIEIVIERDA